MYDNNSIDVWLGETFVMEDIENHLHPEKGETYSESFMYWAGYLFRCWGITDPEESAQDMLRQAPVETLRKSYVGMHVLFFEDATQNLKEIYELVHRIISNQPNDLPDFPSAALSSIDVATATPHSSALHMKNHSASFG